MSDMALTAIALVEAVVMENGETIAAITQSVEQHEMGELCSALAILYAAQMEKTYGIGPAVEELDRMRRLFVQAAGAQP